MAKQYFTASGIDGETVYKRTRRGDVPVASYPSNAPRGRTGNGPAYELAQRLNYPPRHTGWSDE